MQVGGWRIAVASAIRLLPRHPVILFLFLAHLGVGIVFTLAFVSRDAGVKFFRFNAGLAAILIAVALRVPSGWRRRPAPSRIALGVAARLAEAAIVLYWATVGRTLASIRPAIVGRRRASAGWSRWSRRRST